MISIECTRQVESAIFKLRENVWRGHGIISSRTAEACFTRPRSRAPRRGRRGLAAPAPGRRVLVCQWTSTERKYVYQNNNKFIISIEWRPAAYFQVTWSARRYTPCGNDLKNSRLQDKNKESMTSRELRRLRRDRIRNERRENTRSLGASDAGTLSTRRAMGVMK